MIGSVGFVLLRRVLGLLGIGPAPDAKDVEITVLRHQLMVVRRQIPAQVHPLGSSGAGDAGEAAAAGALVGVPGHAGHAAAVAPGPGAASLRSGDWNGPGAPMRPSRLVP